MSFSVRLLPAIVLAIMSLPASLWGQSTAKPTSKGPRGSVSGRVTIKEKGAAGVVVSLRKADNFTAYADYQRATTDQDGSYRIPNVAPGNYQIMPSAPAFVPADSRESVITKTVLVGEDENIDNINFALVRGGVITGKVTDADGRPLIQQEVSIYPANAFDRGALQQPVYRTVSARTDDRGIYRAFGLVPGRYKIAAGKGDDGFSNPSSARATYKQVFHPDVSDPLKATIIEVGEGTEANNVDIALGRELQTFNATGRVIDATTGQPVPNLRFGLQRIMGQRTEYVNSQSASNALGDFIIEGLIPGKYSVYLYPNTNGGMRAEALALEIIDQDVSGLQIKVYKGVSINGVVILETDDKLIRQTLTQLQLRAYVQPPPGGGAGALSATSPVGPDGSFTLTGLPGGTVNFNLALATNPFPFKGLSISRVEREGVAGPQTLEVKESEQVAGVRVFVAYGTGAIRGIVKIENGSLPEGGHIFLRVTKGNEPLRTLPLPPQVDARGHFLIDGLLPGNYEVTAAVGGQQSKREVSVQDGTATDVVITIDMTAPPVRFGQPVIRNP